MNPAHVFRRCSALLVLALASGAAVGVRAVELTASSPFLPPSGGVDTSATPANSPLELHGILSTPDGYKFNLCAPTGHVNVWIGLNAAGQPFVVRSHDVAHNRVTVEYQGRELTLSLPQPKITAMATPMAMQQPQYMGQPPMQPGAINVTANPVNDRQRLEHIAEEIRRRRALRAAAQQQQESPPRTEQYPQPHPQD
jgi:hypothetical protein